MANVASGVLGGFAAGRNIAISEEERGLRAEERVKRNAREEAVAAKAQRLQGYLGKFAQTNEVPQGMMAEDPGMAMKLTEFSDKKQADTAELNAADAAVASEAIGGPEEGAAMVWLAGQLESRGAPQQEIAQAMKQYESTQNPEERSALAKRYIDGFMARGMGAKDWLSSQGSKVGSASALKNVIMSDGTTQSFDTDKADQRTAYQAAIKQGGADAPSRVETGGPGSMTKKEGENLREAEIATRNAIHRADELLAKIKADPDVLNKSTALAGFASGLAAEAKSAAKAFGLKMDPGIQDATKYASTFDELGVKGKVARGLVLDLALSYAAASGLGTGRALTNRDIDMAIKRIGAGGFSTPEARMASIEEVSRIMKSNFKTRYEVMKGKPFEGEFKKTKSAPTQDFKDGDKVNQGGIIYTYTNGEWVSE